MALECFAPAGSHTTPDQGPWYRRSHWLMMTLCVLFALGAALAFKQWRWQIVWPGTMPHESLFVDLRDKTKLLLWFTWPCWPLALWTLWRWRRQLSARHVLLPLWFALVPLAATLSTDFSERSLLLALPAIATLAAFALPTFKRSASALIDWFPWCFSAALPSSSGSTGSRCRPAHQRRWPTASCGWCQVFVPHFSWIALVMAIAATLAWAWLVRWRTGRHQAALWKTLVLPGGGAALCWLLATTLWLPAVDYARSYAPQVRAVALKVGPSPCIAELGLKRTHIAALHHHGHFHLQPINSHTRCEWLLVNPDALPTLHHIIDLEQWRFDSTVRRPTSAGDDLLLYQRRAPP